MSRAERVIAALGLEVADVRGGRAWLICPFHDDHTAGSFFVRLTGDRAGQNHCFSCKGGGSLIALVAQVRNCTREVATAFVRALGEGYEAPRVRSRVVEPPLRAKRRGFDVPKEIFFKPVDEWITLPKRYAFDRGITPEQIEDFRIGYAVDGRLSGRIVIPWISASGRVVGYSARTFVGDEPKYLTPQEDDRADRGVMVGEHLWPPVEERKVVVVTEGALNGLAVRRAVENLPFGALGGSEIEMTHAAKLASFPLVLLLTDPDAAGNKAAEALGAMLRRYTKVERVRTPRGKDANDLPAEDLRRRLVRYLSTPATGAPYFQS